MYIHVHTELHKDIERLGFGPAAQLIALKMASLMGSIRYGHFDEYREFSSEYFRIRFGTHYWSILKPLKEAGIIEADEYYRPGTDGIKGRCKAYRLAQKYFDTPDFIKIKIKQKKAQKFRDTPTMGSKRMLRGLRVDIERRQIPQLIKTIWTKTKVRELLKVDDEIAEDAVQVNGKFFKAKNVIAANRSNSMSLIKDGNRFIVEDLDMYIRRKRCQLIRSYIQQLTWIKTRSNIYSDRNETNFRLDHNLTTLANSLHTFVSWDSQRICNIDLKNSQFRFFVHLLEVIENVIKTYKNPEIQKSKILAAGYDLGIFREEEGEGNKLVKGDHTLLLLNQVTSLTVSGRTGVSFTADYHRFKTLAKTGQLYEYIRDNAGLPYGRSLTRDEAKRMMFEIFFSSHRNHTKGKRILKEMFPSIVKFIDGYKAGVEDKFGKDFKPAKFAVILQRMESHLFVDVILTGLHGSRFKALSKHDSIIVRQSDKRHAAARICAELNWYFGAGTYVLTIDGDEWKKRQKSRRSLAGMFQRMRSATERAAPVFVRARATTNMSKQVIRHIFSQSGRKKLDPDGHRWSFADH